MRNDLDIMMQQRCSKLHNEALAKVKEMSEVNTRSRELQVEICAMVTEIKALINALSVSPNRDNDIDDFINDLKNQNIY